MRASHDIWDRRDACPTLSRRSFIGTGALGLLALVPSAIWSAEDRKKGKLSIAEAFDREVEPFMKARKVPGGALAVVKDRRLVYARGYGWADREKRIPARPESLFRIASLSKPITAVAVLKLVEAGQLKLEDRAFDIVNLPAHVSAGKKPDPKLKQITIRQLLQHTGGWDRDKSGDPMFLCQEIAQALGVDSPPGPRQIIQYMLGQPLDFDPGTRYAYSNFGYCVLGRVIEKLAGLTYEKHVQQQVLEPAGIKRMRIGASLEHNRRPDEVRYYMRRNQLTTSVFSGGFDELPWPYGGFFLEAMDAHGGWVASAIDLARFAAALDDTEHSPLLKPDTFRIMDAPPAAPVSRGPDGSLEDYYYGCGWLIRPVGKEGKANYWHAGSLPGTYTLLVRRWDGLSWAVLFNQRTSDKKLPDSAIDVALHRAADAVSEWPKEDLFKERQETG